MVKGLEVFRDRFRDFSDSYILIGGSACSLAMDEVGQDFRATKDLDIVLCVEALTTEFFHAFWTFIEEGRYTHRQKSSDRNILYRFFNPENDSFPYMIELFSRMPDISGFEVTGTLTPIPAGEDASSLSAILLDTDYYDFLHRGIKHTDGVSYAGPEIIIPLKAKAWIDLTARKGRGEPVDSRDIKKHLKDIPVLFRIVSPESAMDLPETIARDLEQFLDSASLQSEVVAVLSERMKGFYHLTR